jgi:hypothetical protein
LVNDKIWNPIGEELMAAREIARRDTTEPASDAEAITPHDSNELTFETRAIYVGSGGDLRVEMADGGTVTFPGVLAGTVYPISVKQVYDTGTTASDLVALW